MMIKDFKEAYNNMPHDIKSNISAAFYMSLILIMFIVFVFNIYVGFALFMFVVFCFCLKSIHYICKTFKRHWPKAKNEL